MKTIQKIHIGSERLKFCDEVNDLLEKGWKVIPETVNASIALSGEYRKEYIFAVVLEKEEK
jgi:hypothetical protein